MLTNNRCRMKHVLNGVLSSGIACLLLVSGVSNAESCDMEDLNHYRSVVRAIRSLSSQHADLVNLAAKIYVKYGLLEEKNKKIVEEDINYLLNTMRGFTQLGMLHINTLSNFYDYKSQDHIIRNINNEGEAKFQQLRHIVGNINANMKHLEPTWLDLDVMVGEGVNNAKNQ